MKLKITKCSRNVWWYKEHVGKEYEIDLNVCKIEQDIDGVFIWVPFKNHITLYSSKRGILLDDTNYSIIIRKQKLEKIEKYVQIKN